MDNSELKEKTVKQLRFCDKLIEKSLLNVVDCIGTDKVGYMQSDAISTEMAESVMPFYTITDSKVASEFILDWASDMTLDTFLAKYHKYLNDTETNQHELLVRVFSWRETYCNIFASILRALGIDTNCLFTLGTASNVASMLLNIAVNVCSIQFVEYQDTERDWQEEMVRDWANRSMTPERFANKYSRNMMVS